jgi:aminoglycoside phosphotransferase (APT) family kinase protein
MPANAHVVLTPLTGGVSCDVWKVDSPGATFAAKRALPRLRTAAEWLAPVERAESEVGWLRHVSLIAPDAVPRVLAHSPADHLFVMAYLDPADHPVWRNELIAGRIDTDFAAALGRVLAAIHSATASNSTVARQFHTEALFHALRIDPFLLYVAERDPEVGPRIRQIAEELSGRKTALVHGDVSPKNILVGPSGPVLLDAECAVFGDPAFDLAFCLTHLLIKAVWLSDREADLMRSARALADAYLAKADWEDAANLEGRAASLAAALLLARVDGKSPAAYLGEAERNRVRRGARAALAPRRIDLDLLFTLWPDRTS